MRDVFRKSWLRKCDRSPSKSISPARSFVGLDFSPVKFFDIENPENISPVRATKNGNGLIISPERGNPFRNASPSPSPDKQITRRLKRQNDFRESDGGFNLMKIETAGVSGLR